jgi:hypothetical protein
VKLAQLAIWHLLICLEAVAIDTINRRNVPEGLSKINMNRKTRTSRYTQLNVITHLMATEADIYASQRIIKNYLEA